MYSDRWLRSGKKITWAVEKGNFFFFQKLVPPLPTLARRSCSFLICSLLRQEEGLGCLSLCPPAQGGIRKYQSHRVHTPHLPPEKGEVRPQRGGLRSITLEQWGRRGFMRSCQQGSAHPSTALGAFSTSGLSGGALQSGCGV